MDQILSLIHILYSLEKHQESQEKLNATGLFTSTNFNFTPHDDSDTCSILDLDIDCLFDKPYDFYVEAYGRGKTSGKYGPELIVGVTKRNAFRGAELLKMCIRDRAWTSSIRIRRST